ncbi:MAG: hypothetical protein MUF21_09535 [Gemmatimonadaceae bacterium]|nr:hypothetical protein [Gemmatimonadaceae bacterium]
MTRTTRLGALACGVLAIGCSSLDVGNSNAPDRERAISRGTDLVSLLGGAMQNWVLAQQGETPAIATSTMALQFSMSWGNFGSRVYSSVPRVQFNNAATDPNIGIVNTPWYNNYGTIASSNIALAQIRAGVVPVVDGQDQTVLARSVARFLQGASMANIALFFNQGLYADENTPQDSAQFISRQAMRDSALAKLDSAIALAGTGSFTLPETFLLTTGWTSTQLRQVANTEAARLLAYFPRSAAENAQVPWARVAQYASRGLSAGTAFSPTIRGDQNVFYDGWKAYVGMWDNWMRVNQRVVRLLDPSQPTPYPTTGRPPAPVSPDARFDPTPRTAAAIGSETADFIYVPFDFFNPARGRYHFSDVGYNRYGCHGFSAPDGGGLCEVPIRIAAENDLLWAEALVRSGGSRSQAAQLINNSRVTRGRLPALTGAEAGAGNIPGLAPLAGADNNDVLLRAIFFASPPSRWWRRTTWRARRASSRCRRASWRRCAGRSTRSAVPTASPGASRARRTSRRSSSRCRATIGGQPVSGPGAVLDDARAANAAARRQRWLPRN